MLIIPWNEKIPPTTDYFFDNYDIFGNGPCEVVEVSVKQLKSTS